MGLAAAICYGSLGGGAALAFHHQLDAYNTDTLIQALGELRRFLGGQKATLLWDGLPAHRSHTMRVWLGRQRSWLVAEPLPGYAPDLHPVEALWANLKGVELVNLAGETLHEVIAPAERGIQRIRDTTTWPTRSCANAAWPCGEQRASRWNGADPTTLTWPVAAWWAGSRGRSRPRAPWGRAGPVSGPSSGNS